MTINMQEHRELADYIARKVIQDLVEHRGTMEIIGCASVIWDAIEDYTAKFDPTPDPEDTGRADDFADHYFTRSL